MHEVQTSVRLKFFQMMNGFLLSIFHMNFHHDGFYHQLSSRNIRELNETFFIAVEKGSTLIDDLLQFEIFRFSIENQFNFDRLLLEHDVH